MMRRFFSSDASRSVLVIVITGILAVIIGFFSVNKLMDTRKSSAGCSGICVALKPDGMSRDELAVKRGETVTFYSADGKNHNISEGDGASDDGHAHEHVGEYLSGEFGPDEAWRVKFKETGTYKLHDHYNPKQRILVVVYEDK